MPDFVHDSTTLPAPKVNDRPLPTGADPKHYVAAEDYNALRSALLDVRSAILTDEQALATTQQTLATVQQGLGTTQQSLTTTQQTLTTTTQNLTTAQQGLSTAQQTLTTVQQDLTATQQTLTTAQQDLTATQEDVAALQQARTAADAVMAALEASLAETDAAVDALEALPDGQPAMWHDVRAFGTLGTANDSPVFQAALNAARDSATVKEVRVPGGTFVLQDILYIASNVTLRLEPTTTLRRGANTTAMLLNQSAGSVGGYGANSNIRVIGGIWDANGVDFPTSCTAIAFGHCTDVFIERVAITNIPGYHHIEINGCFRAWVSKSMMLQGTVTGDESIQVDGMYGSGPFPWFGPYDNTPCKSVVVEDCYFNTQNTGVGTHSAATGVKHPDIVVRGCIFDGLNGAGVAPYGWSQSAITGNVFMACRAGVRLTTPNVDTTTICDGLEISRNRWSGYKAGGAEAQCIYLTCGTATRPQVRFISVVGNVLDDTGGGMVRIEYGEEITITGNVLSRPNGARAHVNLANCHTSTISGNTLNDGYAGGVSVVSCTNTTVSGNTLRLARGVGVEVTSSPRTLVADNNILDCIGFVNNNGYGITVTTSAGVALRGNTITNCARDGIRLVTVTDSAITNNRVENTSTQTNATYSSISVTSASNNNLITGNQCRMAASGNRPAYGLRIEADCTGNIAAINDLLNSGVTASYSDAGAGTITTLTNRT